LTLQKCQKIVHINQWNHVAGLTHFLPCDEPIPVQVVQSECPLQLFVQIASAGDGQGFDEFMEFNGTILKMKEGIKGIIKRNDFYRGILAKKMKGFSIDQQDFELALEKSDFNGIKESSI
jgi:hypothetical protein